MGAPDHLARCSMLLLLVARMNGRTSNRSAAALVSERNLVRVSGVELEIERRGRGRPLLVLYGEEALELDAPVLAELARDHELIIPSPPGFGRSERPDWIESPDDIGYIYLDLMERLDVGKVPAIGFSFGGWLALEMATKDDSFFSKLVLVDPYGVKVGGPMDRDIEDVWNIHPERVAKLKWFDGEKGKRDFTAMPEGELAIIARNNESFARFCWDPCMHNPKLARRLHRVRVPTLFVWGANDGIVSPDYGRAYSRMIAGAEFSVIGKAGHYPHLEQPDEFMRLVRGFLE
jgi:pimeloyl-ACP methyl ester carboxylesterase